MNLKKIKPTLKESLVEAGLLEANQIQLDTFSTIKSGADCLILCPPKSGKTTTIALNVLQRVNAEEEESPRALILVETKERVIELKNIFEKIGKYVKLNVYGVHEKGDFDYDKNIISCGIDVLIGTPTKINELFSSAGFNVNRLQMFIIDDADLLVKARHDAKITRISNSIPKVQRIIFATEITEKLEIFADKLLIEPFWFDFYEYEEDIDNEEETDNE